jgi:hypothetical protein
MYGEAAKACSRLQEEIIKTSSDYTIFAGNRPPFSTGLPFRGHFLTLSPEFFCSEKRIVQWPGFQFLEEPHSISNVGLSIMFPVSTTNSGALFAFLGCFYEDEPSGPNGVFLKAWDNRE